MLTKNEAAATWCPMVRIARREVTEQRTPVGFDGMELVKQQDHIVGGCNTDALSRSRVPASCRCIADGCAMWRWGEPDPARRDQEAFWPDEDEPIAEPPRPDTVPVDAVWIPLTGEGDDMEGGFWEEAPEAVAADNAKAVAARRGYCGLAGRPS